jgi:hypothetical protein
VHNILDSFSDPLSRPFFSLNLPDKLLVDIINGDLIIVLCFDHELFVKKANKKYPGLYFYSSFPSEVKKTKAMISVDGKVIGSYVDNNISYLGNGYESRVIFDQQQPVSLIDWGYKMSDLKKNIDKERKRNNVKLRKRIKEKRKRSR